MDLYKFGWDIAKQQAEEEERKKSAQEIFDAIEQDGIDWEHERNMELEADHADELE